MEPRVEHLGHPLWEIKTRFLIEMSNNFRYNCRVKATRVVNPIHSSAGRKGVIVRSNNSLYIVMFCPKYILNMSLTIKVT